MDLWPANEISFLNFSELVRKEENNPFPVSGFYILLSDKVTIRKRRVYDALMMFGDVGGLRDFLAVGLSAVFTVFADRMMLASLVQKVFHASTDHRVPVPIATKSPDQVHRQVSKALKSIEKVQFSVFFTMINALTFGKCTKQEELRRKALNAGAKRLERHLDIVNLIR